MLRTIAGLLALAATGGGVSNPRPHERRFVFEYQAKVPAEDGDVHLWVPIPHDDPYQKISNLQVQSSLPYKVETDALGNHILSVETRQGGAAVTLRFECVRQEHIQPVTTVSERRVPELTPEERRHWLASDRLVPLDPKIRKWAREVVDAAGAKTDLEMARAIYNHVVATVKYDKTGKGWGRGDIYYACDTRRGNCTDFHAIFIGYARAMGIPARFSIGFPIPTAHGSGTIAGYHCWAEFYAKGIGWVPVDASEAAKDPTRREYFFGAHDENRVEFTRGRDLRLKPRQAGEPLNYFIYPYAEAGGKPVENVAHVFTWKDEAPATATLNQGSLNQHGKAF
ncbi:MAG TPA: transglutaminase [Solibacterales bacterium]|nr:transglutaminase [Bryobacterales bacterium]